MGVDDAGDHVVVHVARLARDDLGDGHALILGLVRKHRAGDRVTDGVDAVDAGFPMVVRLDLAALVHVDAQVRQAQPVGIGFAARGDEDGIGIDGLFGVVLLGLVGDLGFLALDLNPLNGGPKDELHALLGEDFLEVLLHLTVHPRRDGVEVFNNRDLCPKASIDRPHLQPDDACADDDQLTRDLSQRQRAGGGDDRFFIDLDAGQRRRL